MLFFDHLLAKYFETYEMNDQNVCTHMYSKSKGNMLLVFT